MKDQFIRILLIEDDEDDYVVIRDTLSEINTWEFRLDWVSTPDREMDRIISREYQVCLLDYRLGNKNGIEVLEELNQKGFKAPVIILTGYTDHEIDVEAMRHGAVDYLEKSDLKAFQLERAIRYAIRNSDIIKALRTSEEKLRILSSHILEAQEKERKAVAQDLHDSIGASLTAIRFALERKIDSMGSSAVPDSGALSLERIMEMLKEIIEETQRISSNLRPSTLDTLGLLPSIRSFGKKYQEIYGDIRLEMHLDVSEKDIPEKLKIILYRIIQESFNNSAKHSQAENMYLRIIKNGNCLELTIRDDGRGFNVEKTLLESDIPEVR
jgi:signal transduction histidine kinase